MRSNEYAHEIALEVLGHLWRNSNTTRKKQFTALSALVIASSIAEAFSIAAIIPFLSALTNPQQLLEIPGVKKIAVFFNASSDDSIVLMVTIGFVLIVAIAAILRLGLLWANIRVSNLIGSELSEDIYRRTLYQPYVIHLERNSSQIIDGITRKVSSLTNGLVNPFLNMMTSGAILISILTTLVYLNSYASIISIIGFAVIYLLIIYFVKEKLSKNGIRVSYESTQTIKALQEGLGGIRDVLIDGTQETFCKIYSKADRPYRKAAGSNAFINSSPRYLIEALGIILIATLAVSFVGGDSGFLDSIPFLGALALGAQKSLPLMQQFYASWTSIKGSQASVADAMYLLDQPLPIDIDLNRKYEINFEKKIELRNVSFKYSAKSKQVLNDISISIPKGSKIGLIGPTGAGKSTLADVLMGLIEPSKGALLVDGIEITKKNIRAWQTKIGHVPQFIYLADSSIEENIAFGICKSKIDYAMVRKAAELAQIADVIKDLPDGYKTLIGERGVKLSGGQRQRLGIARAFYKQSSVIFFDEATSALDHDTERYVMDAINSIGKQVTLIIVAHRISTLKDCDFIIEISAGRLKTITSYSDIVKYK
jgi:ABC-type multidrug transport system fused ATPase/permease subunit